MPSIKNKREEAVREEAQRAGWQVLDKGWPDFLLFDRATCEVIFVEVKSCSDRVRKQQKLMHTILQGLDLNVKVVRVGGNTNKHRQKIREAIKRKNPLGLTA